MNENEIGILRGRQAKRHEAGDALGTAQIGVVIALVESLGGKKMDRRIDLLLEEIGERVQHQGEDELVIALNNWLTRAGAATDATRKAVEYGLYKEGPNR